MMLCGKLPWYHHTRMRANTLITGCLADRYRPELCGPDSLYPEAAGVLMAFAKGQLQALPTWIDLLLACAVVGCFGRGSAHVPLQLQLVRHYDSKYERMQQVGPRGACCGSKAAAL